MPATTPLATGNIATPSACKEPNASSSSAPITTLPAIVSHFTSRSIWLRLITAKTPAPLTSSFRSGAANGANAL